jgi:hypothetical protein
MNIVKRIFDYFRNFGKKPKVETEIDRKLYIKYEFVGWDYTGLTKNNSSISGYVIPVYAWTLNGKIIPKRERL